MQIRNSVQAGSRVGVGYKGEARETRGDVIYVDGNAAADIQNVFGDEDLDSHLSELREKNAQIFG